MLGGVGFASVIAVDAGVVDVVNNTGPTTFKKNGRTTCCIVKSSGINDLQNYIINIINYII